MFDDILVHAWCFRGDIEFGIWLKHLHLWHSQSSKFGLCNQLPDTTRTVWTTIHRFGSKNVTFRIWVQIESDLPNMTCRCSRWLLQVIFLLSLPPLFPLSLSMTSSWHHFHHFHLFSLLLQLSSMTTTCMSFHINRSQILLSLSLSLLMTSTSYVTSTGARFCFQYPFHFQWNLQVIWRQQESNFASSITFTFNEIYKWYDVNRSPMWQAPSHFCEPVHPSTGTYSIRVMII